MRSMTGAETFCAIRSHLASVACRAIGWLDVLSQAGLGQPADSRHNINRDRRRAPARWP
jgi:hypothetical protein